MLSIEDVRAQVARVDHKVDGITFRWNVSMAWETTGPTGARPEAPEIGYFIQIEYDEVDIDDPHGPALVQQGRRWFVGLNVSESEVIQTCLKAALASAEHRTREWFLVDGVRAYGPHMDADKLVEMLKGEWKPIESDGGAVAWREIT